MRFSKPQYMNRFVPNPAAVSLNSGETVVVYSIAVGLTDAELNEWAKHILAHYISNDNIARAANVKKITEAEFIEGFVLPSLLTKEGLRDVSGNFGEILFCDFIEYVLGYSVPRYKLYANQAGNPTQGIDIIAYKKDTTSSANDTIMYTEIKSVLSKSSFETLQKAINDIEKRKDKDFALALNTAVQKLLLMGEDGEAAEVERFSDSEKPCRRVLGAGLITAADICTSADFVGVNITNGKTIEAHVIHAPELWEIAKDLWRRAAL